MYESEESKDKIFLLEAIFLCHEWKKVPGLDLLVHTLVDLQLLMNEEQSPYLSTSKCKSLYAEEKVDRWLFARSIFELPVRQLHGPHLFFTACEDAVSSICGSTPAPVCGFTVPSPLPSPLSTNTPLKTKSDTVAVSWESERHLRKGNLLDVMISVRTFFFSQEICVKLLLYFSLY